MTPYNNHAKTGIRKKPKKRMKSKFGWCFSVLGQKCCRFVAFWIKMILVPGYKRPVGYSIAPRAQERYRTCSGHKTQPTGHLFMSLGMILLSCTRHACPNRQYNSGWHTASSGLKQWGTSCLTTTYPSCTTLTDLYPPCHCRSHSRSHPLPWHPAVPTAPAHHPHPFWLPAAS